jgi:hypothetical protein
VDLNRDELRRQLHEVDAQNTAVMPKWREVLERVFSGDIPMSTDEKAQLLGVPGRRQFFKVGGATIAGAALLAACGDDDESAVTAPADTDTDTDTEVDADADGGNMDIVLANTAISLEVLAVNTYQTAIDSGLVTTAAVGDAAKLFQEHHAAHRDALIATVEQAGATPFTETNAVVKSALVDPVLATDGLDEAGIIKVAFDLEKAAAQTYVFAATALSTPTLRSTIMTIGGVESRHATILGQVAGFDTATVFPGAFYKSENPLPEGAVITG